GPCEELLRRRRALDLCERLEGEEERAGEAPALVGERDEHEAPARPDVERVLLEEEAAGGAGGERQLLVAEVENFLCRGGGDCLAHRGGAAVRAEGDPGGDLALRPGPLAAHPRGMGLGI